MASFNYTNLQNDSSFRIAILQPGEFTDDVKISLIHAEFDDNESYEALSYVWGDHNTTQVIFCEGFPFHITANLFLALRRLRHKDKPRKMWIDSMCINQGNIEEREQQVSQMKEIYSRASKVILWIGEDDALANSAWHLAGLVLNTCTEVANPTAGDDPMERMRLRNIITSHRWFHEHAKNAAKFLESQWFRRVWTFQEVYLSKDAQIVCGAITFPWAHFVCSWDLMLRMGIKVPLHGIESARTVLATCSWDLLGLNQEENCHLRLSNMVRSTYTHLASDPRDRIFGLLAMVKPREDVQFLPDYRASVEDVYVRYARLMIQDDGHLQILSDVNMENRDPNLPSWVPDWRGTIAITYLAERIRTFKPKYSFHGGCSPAVTIHHTEDERKLALLGAKIATVKDTYTLDQLMDETRVALVQPDRWKQLIAYFSEFYHRNDRLQFHFPSEYHHTDESTFSAFIRTLAADYYPGSNRLPKEDLVEFYPFSYDYQNLTWKEAISPIRIDDATVGNLANTETGAPLQEVLDLLFEKENPTMWSFPLSSRSRLKIESIYCQVASEILRAIEVACKGRVFFVTDNGYMGLAPTGSKAGDHVFGLFGGDVPFILRYRNGNEFELVGETYVHGIMDGEIWTHPEDTTRVDSQDGTLTWEKTVLV